jgi:hypothetical protein
MKKYKFSDQLALYSKCEMLNNEKLIFGISHNSLNTKHVIIGGIFTWRTYIEPERIFTKLFGISIALIRVIL